MAWKTVQTQELFPDAEGIVFNEIASLMAMNEALVQPVMRNFWGLDRGLVGSPNPRQDYLDKLYDDFAKDNPQDDVLTLLLYGSTRSGKTVGTIAKFVKILVQYPGTKALGSRRTYTQLADSLVPSVVEFLGKAGYVKNEDYEFRGGDRPGLYFKNGSSWVFRSTENANKAGEGKADNLGGTEYDIALLEECDEIQELFFDTVVGRMSGRRAPARMIVCIENPPSEEHWTYRKWFKDRAADPRDNIKAIHFPTEDNERNLPPGYIRSLEEAYKDSPALYRKFRLGLFTPSIKGRPVFQGYFNRKIHVPPGDKTLTWNPKYPIWRIWDFGFRRPACVFAQEDKESGQIKWLRAHLGNDELLMPFAKKMINNSKKWYTDSKGNAAQFIDICDQAGKKRSSTSDKSEIQVLEGLGLRPRYKFTKIEYGVQLLYQELSSILPGGIPAMIFDPVHCGILIDAFEFGYTQDPDAKDDVIKPVKDGRYDHCLTGDTEVRTLEGWVPIRDLVGRDFWVLAWSEAERRLVPAKAHNARVTRENAEVWELVHDGGSVRATPDHRFMLRDGTYRELQHLQPGDELMPMYEVQRNRTGHRSIKLNDGSMVYEHQYVYAKCNGHLREGHVVHHLDHNGANNNPDNLVQVTTREHYDLHKKADREAADRTGTHPKMKAMHDWAPESRDKVSAWAKQWYEDNRVEKACIECGKTFQGIYRSKYCSTKCQYRFLGRKRREKDVRPFSTPTNHKVLEVRPRVGIEDVYCLCVPEHHNFAANGVFVHNCMDCCRYAVVMFREITNQTVPKRVAKRLYRTLTDDGSYAEKVMRDLRGRKGPSYNFGRPKREEV